MGKLSRTASDPVEHAVVEVVEHAADPGIARVESIAGHLLVDVVDQLAEVEGEQERGERAEVERGGARAEQVVADPRQLAR